MEKQLQSTDPQPIEPAAYQQLIATIGQALEAGRVRAYRVAKQLAHKNDILVEYTLGGLTNPIFVSKYQLYLPDRTLLEQKIRRILEEESANDKNTAL